MFVFQNSKSMVSLQGDIVQFTSFNFIYSGNAPQFPFPQANNVTVLLGFLPEIFYACTRKIIMFPFPPFYKNASVVCALSCTLCSFRYLHSDIFPQHRKTIISHYNGCRVFNCNGYIKNLTNWYSINVCLDYVPIYCCYQQ